MDKEYPEEGKLDIAQKVGKGILGAIPIIGSLVQEAYDTILPAPVERRRKLFFDELLQELDELHKKTNFSIEDLQDSDEYYFSVKNIIQQVFNDQDSNKLEIYRNIILNCTVAPKILKDAQVKFYLDLVKKFNFVHILMMRFFVDPMSWIKKNNIDYDPQSIDIGSIISMLLQIFPTIPENQFKSCMNDIYNEGFSRSNGSTIYNGMTGGGTVSQRINEKGRAFLEFLSSPMNK